MFIVGPLIWVAVASIQGENELLRKPPRIIPQNPTLDNYNYVFTGEIPTSYEVKGQLRSRISRGTPDPRSVKKQFYRCYCSNVYQSYHWIYRRLYILTITI